MHVIIATVLRILDHWLQPLSKVICGAGVVGCSTAYYLRRCEANCVLLVRTVLSLFGLFEDLPYNQGVNLLRRRS